MQFDLVLGLTGMPWKQATGILTLQVRWDPLSGLYLRAIEDLRAIVYMFIYIAAIFVVMCIGHLWMQLQLQLSMFISSCMCPPIAACTYLSGNLLPSSLSKVEHTCMTQYENEDVMGEGLKEFLQAGPQNRSKLFLTSKVWNDCHRPEHVRSAQPHYRRSGRQMCQKHAQKDRNVETRELQYIPAEIWPHWICTCVPLVKLIVTRDENLYLDCRQLKDHILPTDQTHTYSSSVCIAHQKSTTSSISLDYSYVKQVQVL